MFIDLFRHDMLFTPFPTINSTGYIDGFNNRDQS